MRGLISELIKLSKPYHVRGSINPARDSLEKLSSHCFQTLNKNLENILSDTAVIMDEMVCSRQATENA